MKIVFISIFFISIYLGINAQCYIDIINLEGFSMPHNVIYYDGMIQYIMPYNGGIIFLNIATSINVYG